MNVLLAASEVAPFAKTGGLADVAGALPRALSRLGHTASVILPYYPRVQPADLPVESTGIKLQIPIAQKVARGELLRSQLPGSDVTVWLVSQPDYYDRPELYRSAGRDYQDNCERFVFFSRSVLEAVRLLGLPVDCIHANDWQTGLVPAYLAIEYRDLPEFSKAASVFTVHNLGYQGQFWHWDMLLTGLDWKYFNWRQMEFYGHLNLLKTGLVFADMLSTVSPRYAEEIQTSEFGCGLQGVLRNRRDGLRGILNGIDYSEWNPATDPHLAARYDEQTYAQGKAECKRALQERFRLAVKPTVPLIGMIGRLADQKGWNLMTEIAGELLEDEIQLVALGQGEPRYHKWLKELQGQHRAKVGVELGFDEALAHQIEGGADMFLMPSRYEPCGLNQLYSLRYGTVPVVRATGGLADTIVDTSPATLAAGTANGFSFRPYSGPALLGTVRRALQSYRDRGVWSQLIGTGMAQDWSWGRTARQYVELYQQAAARCRQAVLA